MPLIEISLEDSLGAITLYKGDLLWLEQRSFELAEKSTYGVWFELNGKQYKVKSIEELIEELKSWGIDELDNLDFMGFTLNIYIGNDYTQLILTEVDGNRKIKYLQILDFLKLKLNKKPEDKTRILLYEKPNPNERGTENVSKVVKEAFTEAVSQSNIGQNVKFVNNEINVTQTDLVNPRTTIITGNNNKTTFSLLGKGKSFWLDVLGVIVAIATIVVTYLLAKGII